MSTPSIEMDNQTEYWFYHLQQSALEQVLPDLLEKTYAKDWRSLVKIGPLSGEPKAELTRLDAYLWTYKKDGFLPHGRDDEPQAGAQPIVLSADANSAQGAHAVFLIGGAELSDMGSAARCITILDGNDQGDVMIARKRWKAVKAMGAKAAYWKQNDHGKWVQPAL